MEGISKGALASNLNEKERAIVIKRIAHFIKKEGTGLGHRRYSCCCCCDGSSNCICCRYAFSYLLCTGLNLLNVVVSIFLLDRFIRKSFHLFLCFLLTTSVVYNIHFQAHQNRTFCHLDPVGLTPLATIRIKGIKPIHS